MQANAFALGGGERPRFVQNGRRDAVSADVVEQPGASGEHGLGFGEPGLVCGGGGEIGDAAGVPGEVRRP